MAVNFELFKVLVTMDIQIHLAALDQFVEERERQMVLADNGLEFLVENELRRLIFAGAADVRAPFGQLFAAFFRREGFFIRHVVHFPAKGIERGHGVAFGARQHHQGERQVGGAFAGDRAAVVHCGQNVGAGGLGGFSSWRIGGNPPFWARGTLGKRDP